MRVAGFDIAKAGFCAAALAVDGVPRRVFAWKVEDGRDSEPEQLDQVADWTDRMLWLMKPDIIVVEELAVFMNKNTIRTLSRREGVILQHAKRYTRKAGGGLVIHPPVTQSRSIVLGKPGNMPKTEAWKRIKKLYPEFQFGHANQGGMDKGDAMTHALAGPTILERR